MKTFIEFLMEGRAFEYQGSRYSSFGKYYKKDGESISKEEYQKASEAYKNSGTKGLKSVKKQVKKNEKSLSTNTATNDNFSSKSKTAALLQKTPFKECKTIKELEKHITEFSGLNCALKGITNKKVANELGKSLHQVLSKYPGVADTHFLNNFVTQEGIKKQAEASVKEYFETEEYKKFVEGEYQNAATKYGFGKEGGWLSKSLQMLGWKTAKIVKFCNENMISGPIWNAKIDENMSKKLKEEFFKVKKEHDVKNLTKSVTPKFKGTSNAYAFYSPCSNTNRKFSGVYLVPSSIKVAEECYAQSVEKGIFPKGTSVGSLVTHEVGHALDEMLNLAKDDELKKLYNPSESIKELSYYAATGGFEEFIAEAISEYVSSETPRPLCKKVGEIVDRKYQEYMRLL
jgi:hypothetical protein